ncbi:uncharacterized protein LOC105843651 isoform X1 [Hydra vulgaris]|uniref:uncharacterized protein LOC105843651 isoform X1 n=1 Tax=Hydra vulgaris TaxID=6087 RepID=UPI0001924310|nr:uncharacterized protein LOC105843651 isoform X1 [Hydra vulgaris]
MFKNVVAVFEVKRLFFIILGVFTINCYQHIYPVWSYSNVNGTVFKTSVYQYTCKPVQKRQQSSCYQRDIKTGIVVFLPVQFYDVIGYSNKTEMIYGYTNRRNIVELNFNRKPALVILTQDRWNDLQANQFVWRLLSTK